MKVLLVRLTLFSLIILFSTISGFSQQTNINGPNGSITFGQHVAALANGNFVVTDPYYSIPGGAQNIGAVFLYNGATKELISVLTGSSTNDYVGYHGVTPLPNGNYVVKSNGWKNGKNTFGAITFCNGLTGIDGEVSENNSLTGSSQFDLINAKITVLTNGNYVVSNSNWSNNGVAHAGAITFGNGTTGISGVISETNSLVGSNILDSIGSGGVIALTNGNYVVSSPSWKNDTSVSAGAVTFGNGKTGVAGVVSEINSLVGSAPFDQIGLKVIALTNGNYVVGSRSWDTGIGAATFGNGTTGISGVISESNSLIGSENGDFVGEHITALTNGNYVVSSPYYRSNDVGAVTFGNGTTGISGVILESNSLLGSTSYDRIGENGVAALTNGNYVISSSNWSRFISFQNTIPSVGAVTFCNWKTECVGYVSLSNSLTGSKGNDRVGIGGVTALTNGNYVIRSQAWHNDEITYAGAVTFGNGATGISGIVSESNSLVGSTPLDSIGFNGIVALANGNYFVSSNHWNNGVIIDVGAVTFGNGETGISGLVSPSNSLVGSKQSDYVGNNVTALTNGNYVVGSYNWDNGLIRDAGAVTFGNGTTGITGAVSSPNSLIGSSADDLVGSGIQALPNGNYVVWNRLWDNGSIENAGSVTYLNGTRSFSGILTSQNSVLGTTAQGGNSLNYSFDAINNQLIVGRPADNLVTIVTQSTGFINVAGRIQTSTGRNIGKAMVSMTDSGGQIRTSITNQFGYYQFNDVAAGEHWTFNVSAKGYSFTPQILTLSDDIKDLNFRAQ